MNPWNPVAKSPSLTNKWRYTFLNCIKVMSGVSTKAGLRLVQHWLSAVLIGWANPCCIHAIKSVSVWNSMLVDFRIRFKDNAELLPMADSLLAQKSCCRIYITIIYGTNIHKKTAFFVFLFSILRLKLVIVVYFIYLSYASVVRDETTYFHYMVTVSSTLYVTGGKSTPNPAFLCWQYQVRLATHPCNTALQVT